MDNKFNLKGKNFGRLTVKASHGMRRTRLYSTWTNMKTRCYNPNAPGFKNYGGRGITVCEEWKGDFVNFYNWAVETGYNDELTIERVDVNGNYDTDNCMWIEADKQNKNRRGNIYIELNGKTETLKGWCNELGLPYKIVHQRMKRRNLNPKENLKWYMNKHEVNEVKENE